MSSILRSIIGWVSIQGAGWPRSKVDRLRPVPQAYQPILGLLAQKRKSQDSRHDGFDETSEKFVSFFSHSRSRLGFRHVV
jgi:hypothetical protein